VISLVLPGVINSFTANTFVVTKATPIILTWSTSNAFPPTLNGNPVATSGSATYNILATQTFTLKAYSEAGGQTKSLTIIVSDVVVPPPVTPPPVTPPPTTVICTPGALKCIGADLYVCNTTGTAWTLKTANSPTCAQVGGEPNFLADPKGWVAWFFLYSWELITGFLLGSFKTLLLNINNFTVNYMAQLVTFIADPVVKLKSWLNGVYVTVSSFISQINSGIVSWWTTTSKSVVDWINNAANGVRAWMNDQIGILQRGWDNVTSGIQAWVNDQIGIFQRGWENVTSGIQTWINDQIGILQRGWNATFGQIPGMITNAINTLRGWIDATVIALKVLIDAANKAVIQWFNDQLGILQRGWDATFGEIPDLIDNAILGIKDFIFDTVPGIVEGVIMGLIESIPGLQTVIDFIGGLYDTLMGKYPKDPELITIQEKQQTAKQKLEAIYGRR
jgi:hypothetical protein